MKLEHFGMAEPGACRLVFTADAAELDAALRAVQAAPDAPADKDDQMTAAVNRAILSGFSTLYEKLVETHHLVPLTDPDFALLAVDRTQGFRAGAEFFCLPPLELERYTGFAELYAQRCAQARQLARQELVYQLGGCVKGPLPKQLVAGNYFAQQRQFNLRLQANNVNFDQYLQVRHQTVEQFRAELHAQAEQKLRGQLGLLMVAEQEQLWPTPAEVDAALAAYQGERTFPANDTRKMSQDIASRRALDFVAAHSTLIDPPTEPVLEAAE